MGPVNQLKKMFAKTRVIATILVFVCIIFFLVSSAFVQFDSKLALSYVFLTVIIAYTKMHGYTPCLPPFLQKGNYSYDFLFSSSQTKKLFQNGVIS